MISANPGFGFCLGNVDRVEFAKFRIVCKSVSCFIFFFINLFQSLAFKLRNMCDMSSLLRHDVIDKSVQIFNDVFCL